METRTLPVVGTIGLDETQSFVDFGWVMSQHNRVPPGVESLQIYLTKLLATPNMKGMLRNVYHT